MGVMQGIFSFVTSGGDDLRYNQRCHLHKCVTGYRPSGSHGCVCVVCVCGVG
jgi:hypothetical protein